METERHIISEEGFLEAARAVLHRNFNTEDFFNQPTKSKLIHIDDVAQEILNILRGNTGALPQ